jgi:hypothetical protein
VFRPADQTEQRIKGLGLERNRACALPQHAISGMQLEIPEAVRHPSRALIFL